ncbi:hypothetical protein ASD78_18105 [Lysobacter sp. Root667]|uniref:NAD(P)/FAD-dependent oxidoreductase n=1 Tax=Lysobacter sp. Root667 TaxID=1736581 RepID=UPI0006F5319F|nr:FAD-binding oxidoreductase [Lysobacter sp. Root667]KRA70738.1 hypothetical protein ASD78_18105 [Lysobacter sp. Root667]
MPRTALDPPIAHGGRDVDATRTIASSLPVALRMSTSDSHDGPIAVIGAGVIGCAVAYALAREGRPVLLIDRAAPGEAGASYGNVGHLATELVEPLPSPGLLFGFWRELYALGGPLDVPVRRLGAFAPWARRFAMAAFRRRAHTQHLAPLVRPAGAAYAQLLAEIGREDLLRRNGHYQFWLSAKGAAQATAEARHMQALGIPTAPVAPDVLANVRTAAGAQHAAGLWFPESGHMLDPQAVCQALAHAAAARGAQLRQLTVRSLEPEGERIAITTADERFSVPAAVVCAGAWSAPLLAPFGLHAPLEAAYGYHVELPDEAAYVDAPALYADQKILVTPMRGRLRASGYMEFGGLDGAPDPRKPARLRSQLAALGYRCAADGPSWRGPRPVLPDYLPGIGRAPGAAPLYYAVGHQHLGLTLAPATADLIADLVAARTPRQDLKSFDLSRFGSPSRQRPSIRATP